MQVEDEASSTYPSLPLLDPRKEPPNAPVLGAADKSDGRVTQEESTQAAARGATHMRRPRLDLRNVLPYSFFSGAIASTNGLKSRNLRSHENL